MYCSRGTDESNTIEESEKEEENVNEPAEEAKSSKLKVGGKVATMITMVTMVIIFVTF